ncbi:MAG TPA: P1 family peptidase [Thermomicrobiales bacterium]|nr:P1 family peptidase [Thermomicrobiales bacterium]
MEILTRSLMNMSGVRVGHWTDTDARTGCTVIRFDEPALSAVEVRGAAPGSRELDLLQPGRTVQRPDAILLSGGSALGLAAADGVVRWMKEHDRGFPTAGGRVPIVPGAVLFDLAIGTPVAPGADEGYEATDRAAPLADVETGHVGAGTGAATGMIAGRDAARSGGFVMAQVCIEEGVVTAMAAVNAYGALNDGMQGDPRREFLRQRVTAPPLGESTTLLACVTDIPLDHDGLIRMTVGMHDGLARSVVPAHTIADGDIAFASTTNERPDCPPERWLRASIAAELAVETAIGTLHGNT